MHTILLVGGAGTGLRIITKGKPKVLLKLLGKTIVEHVLNNLLSIGIDSVVLVSDKPELYEDLTVKYGRIMEVEVVKQYEPEIRGAALAARDYVKDYFLLVYGDVLVPPNAYKIVLDAYKVHKKPSIMVIPEEDVRLYGAVTLSPTNTIKEFIEKPRDTIPGAYACGGIFVLNKEFLAILEEEESMGKALEKYVKLDNVIASVWSGWWVDIGYPWDLLRALYYKLDELKRSSIAKSASIASTAIIKGPVVIEDEAVIDHYALLRGPLYIGQGTFIGSHTMIRTYVDIEEGSSIYSYSEIVWSNIQPKVTIGRASFLGFSVIGEESIIEPNVTTKTLMHLEKDVVKPIEIVKKQRRYLKLGAFIGARTRVPIGKVLEPGSIVE